MGNHHFSFRQFTVRQDQCSMKVCTDACLFGAWVSEHTSSCNTAPNTEVPGSILDIGSGTGLLSLMLAQKSAAFIDCVEIDDNACKQCIENVESSPWRNRINVVCGDIKQAPLTRKYNLIISNPPFYEDSLPSPFEKTNLARHDSGLKLDALVDIASANLAPAGLFAVLVPFQRLAYLESVAAKFHFNLVRLVNVRQTPQHKPFRSMLLFGRANDVAPTRTEMFIKDGAGYTPEFVALVKEYYLYV